MKCTKRKTLIQSESITRKYCFPNLYLPKPDRDLTEAFFFPCPFVNDEQVSFFKIWLIRPDIKAGPINEISKNSSKLFR